MFHGFLLVLLVDSCKLKNEVFLSVDPVVAGSSPVVLDDVKSKLAYTYAPSFGVPNVTRSLGVSDICTMRLGVVRFRTVTLGA